MAGTPVVRVENGTETDNTVYTTASATPSTGKLILLVENAISGATVPPTSVTGMGVTWSLVRSVATPNSNCGGSLWESTGNPTTGALTITFAGTQAHCAWMLVEVPDAASIIQSAILSTAGLNPSISLPGAPAADSAVIGQLVGNASSGVNYTPSHTTLGSRTNLTTPSGCRLVQQDTGSPPTSMSWTTSSGTGKAIIIAEVGGTPGGAAGPKAWTGSAEVAPSEVKFWTGSAEVTPATTQWTGSAEVPLT